MKQNACYFCRTASRRAWGTVTRFLKSAPPFIDGERLDYLRALVRLAYRCDVASKHSAAGFILQGLLNDCRRAYLDEAYQLEFDEMIRYPQHIWQILKVLETKTKVFTSVNPNDFRRYAPHLDKELIDELFGEEL